MKKVIKVFFLFVFFFTFINTISAKEAVMYFFYGDGCPHCTQEKVFLQEMLDKYEDLTIRRYEVWNNSSNKKIMQQKTEELGIKSSGVPITIVGERYVIGYNKSYNETIEDMIKEAILDEEPIAKNESSIKNVAIIGKVDVKKVSLPLIALIIGFVDGFNPCAMWVLLFLISMLIGMKNKKRMWILGITFIVTSALVYMTIMLSWIKLVDGINLSIWFRYIVAVIALIGATLNIRSYIKSKDDGCTIVNDKKREKVFSRIKTFTTERRFILALLGVIALAIGVNFIELACTAGLPLAFSQILAINNVSNSMAVVYTSIYIFFFLLDDLIIFIIAMITLRVTGISTKYTKYSHLIGGILLIIMGALLILKPEWLMFNFGI